MSAMQANRRPFRSVAISFSALISIQTIYSFQVLPGPLFSHGSACLGPFCQASPRSPFARPRPAVYETKRASEPVALKGTRRNLELRHMSSATLVASSAPDDKPAGQSLTDLIGDDIVGRVVAARFGAADYIEEHFRTYRSGKDELELRSYKNDEIPEELRMQYFQVVKRNMQAMYEYSTWGWTDEKKWKDVVNPKTRFVVAVRKKPFGGEEVVGGILYGFELHNRTDTAPDSGEASEPRGVLFLYEFQVAEGYRGRGLGKHLMATIEAVAARARLDRVMLCVFRFNKRALGFYLRSTGYQVDWDCPYNFSQNQTYWVAKNVPGDLPISNLFLVKGAGAGGGAAAQSGPWTVLRAEGGEESASSGASSAAEAPQELQKGEQRATDEETQLASTASTAEEGGSVLGAALLFAGTAVGAGMLALPAETAAAGFWPSEASLVFCWAFTIVTSLVTLEASWAAEPQAGEEGGGAAGVGFVTIARKAFGPAGQAVTAGLLWFLLTSILVAYTSAGGDYVRNLAAAAGVSGVTSKAGSVAFMSGFAALAIAGTRSVDTLNRALVGGLVATFAGLVACGTPLVDAELLARADWGQVWPTGVSIGILSFGAQNVVPTLFEYLQRDAVRTRQAVLLGATLPLAMYSAWEAVFLGVIPYTAGARQEDILQALGAAAGSGLVSRLAMAFGVFAIGSSMAGASASFVDFFADSLANSPARSALTAGKARVGAEGAEEGREEDPGPGGAQKERAVAAAAALLPPLAFALTNEGAFLKALENAGVLGGVTLYGLLPALMVLRMRSEREEPAGDAEEAEPMPGRLPGGAASLVALALGSSALIVPELVRVISGVLPH